ncbi:MAG: glycosyltransferase family 2 protein [Phycisphaerales bacterium]|nr:glycosyltransferase family 2 protein [Phycisphaerales bacterium]
MLADAVASVIDAVDGVVVVDNASADGSVELLERQCAGRPSLTVIRRASNGGFAVACNEGLRAIGWIDRGSEGAPQSRERPRAGASSGSAHADDLVLFLNPDARCLEGTVDALCSSIRSSDRVGAVGGKLVDAQGTEQGGSRRSTPTPWRGFVRAFGLWPLGQWWPQLFPDFHLQRAPLGDQPIDVDAVSGACMMVRRSVLDEVGAFDERYFMHCEDLDLCMRIRGAGYLIKFVPQAHAWHALRGTTGGRTIGTEWHKHRGMVLFYRTYWAPTHAAPLMWMVYAGVWARFSAVALWLALRRAAGRGSRRE